MSSTNQGLFADYKPHNSHHFKYDFISEFACCAYYGGRLYQIGEPRREDASECAESRPFCPDSEA